MMDMSPEQIQPLIDEAMKMLAGYGMSVAGALLTLIVGWMAAKWLSARTLNILRRIPKFDEMLARFLASMVRYTVIVFTALAVLNKFGVQTASVIAVLGAASLAIGLAMQGTLKHIAAGVMLLVFRPFKIGDFIEAAGIAATVSNIGLFMTEMTTPEGLYIVVPNSELWDKPIKNYSHNKTRRIDITLGIAYEDDIGKAIKMVKDILAKDERSLSDPEPLVAVSELADSSVNILVRVWCKSGDFFTFKCDLTRALKEGCDKAGISIPFPQRVVHMPAAATAKSRKAG
ncbi:MAG: mechanosensitive ion channel [Proteobacteria bacterium]|nr:mechanosensitive ion channel [Pseudomonadota bacterium]